MTPAAVFDGMVFIQAPANAKGPACACSELVRGGRLVLHASPGVLAEAADVLSRILEPPALLRWFSQAPPETTPA